MYIQTPKRYRGTQRRRVFSCGRFLLSLVMFLIIFAGIGIYQNRSLLQPSIDRVVSGIAANLEAQAATRMAPPPTATPDPSVNLVNGDNAWQRGNISDAVTFYEQIIGAVPNNVSVYRRVTIGNLTRGNTPDALRYAEHTITADPFSPDAWATRSLVMSWVGKYEQGIASASQALDLDENHPEAMAYLAYSYRGAGQVDLAESRVNEAIRINPDNFVGYWVRGLIRENDLLDIPGALEDFRTAYQLSLEQDPAMTGVAAAGLARILVRPEYADYAQAIELLEQVRNVDPDNRDALFTLGWVQYTYLGDYGQAQGPLEDCTRIAPTDYQCFYFLGRTHNSLGNTEAALEALHSAIEAGTPYARHYWWAANMEIALGSCANAAELLETGYSMVAPGGLPAEDEGAEPLLSDEFPALMTTCRVPIGGAGLDLPTPEATPEG